MKSTLRLKVFLEPGAKAPQKGKPGDAGLDVFAYLPSATLTVKQGDLVKVPLGFRYGLFALDWRGEEYPYAIDNVWLDVRNRSGVGTKSGMATVAEVGDGNYRGILHYCAAKITPGEFLIEDGMKIAQIMTVPFTDPRQVEIVVVSSVEELGTSSRGEGGFGESGVF